MALKDYSIGSVKFDSMRGRINGLVNQMDTWVDLGGEGSNAQITATMAPPSPLSCSKILASIDDVETYCASIEALIGTIQVVISGSNKKTRCLIRSVTFDVKGGSGASKSLQGNQLVLASIIVEALKQDS